MTEKIFNEKIERMGGTVDYFAGVITFPKTLRIKTKAEAIDMLDIFLNFDDVGGTAKKAGVTYQIDEEPAYKALKEFIKKRTA